MIARRWVYGCLLCVGVLGCDSGPKPVTVTGKVTWEGKPLPKGHIQFIDPEGQVITGAGPITEGSYSVEVFPGAKRVEIEADREVGTRDPVMGTIERETYIPARYNTESKLTAEVKSEGANEFDFALTEKPK